MKEKTYSPYGTFSMEKINAPRPKAKPEPKCTKITGKGDLRSKGNK
ncbi:MAG: hypothetical protein IJW38_04165 [Clostridia bacterium]|nr:hypothetical protein [Clostridia bacterium]